MKQYYFSNGQDPFGPFTLEELSKQAITPNSLVWHEGLADWQPANQVAELRSLITIAPPPIRRISPPILPPPITIHQTEQDKKELSNSSSRTLSAGNNAVNSRKKYYLIGGSLLLLLFLLFSGILGNLFHSNSTKTSLDNGIYPATVPSTIETAAASSSNSSQGVDYGKIEEIQKTVRAEREQKQAWNRKHFLGFINASVKAIIQAPLGGISSGIFTVRNQSGYRLENIVVMVNYHKPNGQLINSKSVEVGNVAAHETQEVSFPNSSRGVRADCYLISLDAPGLGYHYNFYEQESDIGRTSYE